MIRSNSDSTGWSSDLIHWSKDSILWNNVFPIWNPVRLPWNSGLANLESGQLSMANRLTNIELTLENEVSRNICTIAEAHLDLSRKFDRALKVKEDDELVRIRLNVLENDVRKIKQRLEIA